MEEGEEECRARELEKQTKDRGAVFTVSHHVPGTFLKMKRENIQ